MRSLLQISDPNQYVAGFLKHPRPIDILPHSDCNTNVNKGTRIEDELVVMAKAGNRDAFYQLEKKYKSAILARLKTRVHNSEDIEDIERNFWEEVREKIHEFDVEKGSFYTWLLEFRLRSVLRDYWRSKSKVLTFSDIEENRNIDGRIPLQPIYFNYFKNLSPEDYAIICDSVVKRLDIVLFKGGPPHQTLVYCLNKMLSKWNSKGSIGKIYRELSSKDLFQISKIVFKEYINETKIRKYISEKCWSKEIDKTAEKFQARMRMKLKDVLPIHNPKSKLNYTEEFMNCIVGHTKLKDYYGEKPIKKHIRLGLQGQ